MSDDDTARSLIDSVFGGADALDEAHQHGPVCMHTVMTIVRHHEQGQDKAATQTLEDYVYRAVSVQTGLRNVCSADVVLIAQLLWEAETTVPHGYAIAVDDEMPLVQTVALDAINHAGTGNFDAIDTAFDGLIALYGTDGLQWLAGELIKVHVHLRRMIREDQHP